MKCWLEVSFSLHSSKSQTREGGHIDHLCVCMGENLCAFVCDVQSHSWCSESWLDPVSWKQKPSSDHPWISSIVIHAAVPVATLCNPSSHWHLFAEDSLRNAKVLAMIWFISRNVIWNLLSNRFPQKWNGKKREKEMLTKCRHMLAGSWQTEWWIKTCFPDSQQTRLILTAIHSLTSSTNNN